VIIIRPIWI